MKVIGLIPGKPIMRSGEGRGQKDPEKKHECNKVPALSRGNIKILEYWNNGMME